MKVSIPVTRFWMRNNLDGAIEVLVEHKGKWLTVFGAKGPGPVARDPEQVIDHMIHAGGVQNLLDYGTVRGKPSRIVFTQAWTHSGTPVIVARSDQSDAPVRGRKPRKPDRRQIERRADKRRTDDKRKARLRSARRG